MKYEWDENKNQTNIRKHGISFQEAATVFEREDSIIFDDPDHSVQEDRFLIIGFSESLNLCVVCWCERRTDTIRIISARKATKSEALDFQALSGRFYI